MIHWVMPWTTDEVIDFFFLTFTCAIATAVPVVYGSRANLRDPLARAVLYGTAATAIAFCVSWVLTIAVHAGWNPHEQVYHWVARSIYTTVALGKLALLLAILKLLRGEREFRRGFQKEGQGAP